MGGDTAARGVKGWSVMRVDPLAVGGWAYPGDAGYGALEVLGGAPGTSAAGGPAHSTLRALICCGSGSWPESLIGIAGSRGFASSGAIVSHGQLLSARLEGLDGHQV